MNQTVQPMLNQTMNQTVRKLAWCASGLLALLFVTSVAQAAIKLPAIVGDHMVLQRDREVPIWGWDDPNTEVKVSLGASKATAKAGADGKWLVKLAALPAGGPHVLTIEGTNKVEVKDVLIGEVWFCSGQSNMEWPVSMSDNPQEEIKNANHPRIRHIKIPHVPSATPQSEVASPGWTICAPETVGDYTAVGYFFGRALEKDLDVPVGLIGCNWGGTRIEPWTPPAGFAAVPALADFTNNIAKYPEKNEKGEINHQSPLALYNGMVAPLVPYAIRGALWYQGESNNGEGMLYHEKMKALIAGWRSVWNDPQLPFLYVQLAPYKYGGDPKQLAGIWEAQAKTLNVHGTGMAVTVDIGNVADIHPRNKQDVGKRLELWALNNVYGKKGLVYSGPLYRSLKIDGDKARVTFDHIGEGLVSRDGKPLSFFQVAGEDQKFVDAQAKIEGNEVVVQAAGVAKPVAVRFGWHQEAEPNLSNKAGLPASPFRTDDWK